MIILEHYNKKEIEERVKNYIDNLLLDIELGEEKTFPKKYERLQDLVPEISLADLGENYLNGYKKIVKFYKDHYSGFVGGAIG